MTRSTARILNLTRRCKKGLSNTIAVLQLFKAQWLLCVLQGLTLKKLYFLLTQCIYVFCTDLRKKKLLFPYTALTD